MKAGSSCFQLGIASWFRRTTNGAAVSADSLVAIKSDRYSQSLLWPQAVCSSEAVQIQYRH